MINIIYNLLVNLTLKNSRNSKTQLIK